MRVVRSALESTFASLGLVATLAMSLSFAAVPAHAQTTHVVSLSGFSFDPNNLVIDVGDTVEWVWVSGFHNVESGIGGVPDGKFSSGAPTLGGGPFSVTFDSAFLSANPAAGNLYDYFCSVHVGLGMTGTIVVLEPDTTPPTLTCPEFVAVAGDGTGQATVHFTVTAVDDVDPLPSVSCVPPSGSVFLEGSTSVTCTATDSAGNSSQCSFDVVVEAEYFDDPVVEPTQLYQVVPAAWDAPIVPWSGDSLNGNKIDDQIELNPFGVPDFDVVVNYRRPVTSADVLFLQTLGANVEACKYLPTVTVSNVTLAQVQQIADDESVAFIEQRRGFTIMSDFSVKTIKAASSALYSTSNVQDEYGYDGSGVNIAVIDSGVDNQSPFAVGTVHDAFPASRFVAGYDAFTGLGGANVDPDDNGLYGHGTKVATIVLGSAVTDGTNTVRGVAPGAGLVDVKVFSDASIIDCLNPFDNAEAGWVRLMQALEWVLDNRDVYGIRVVNMSIAQCDNTLAMPPVSFGVIPSNGYDAISQMVDLMSSAGIVMCAAAGNFGGALGDDIAAPGAATRAITVGASFDKNTIERTDDIIWQLSSAGPRDSDCDLACVDELKPEVVAPGVNVLCGLFNSTGGFVNDSGTSLGTAHVSGLAALLLEADPALDPAGVKELIINTAQQLGSPAGGCEPRWDAEWGWGLIDAYEAVTMIEDAAGKTDLTFESVAQGVPWSSPDILTDPFPPVAGVPARVTAKIRNAGTAVAENVRVEFGTSVFSGTVSSFYGISTQIVPEIQAGASVDVIADWLPVDSRHQTLEVEIGYGADTDLSNNRATYSVIRTTDPVARFEVENTISPGSATIEIDTTCEKSTGGNAACASVTDWTVTTAPTSVSLLPTDDPVEIVVTTVPSPTALDGDEITVHLAATSSSNLLGGVTIVSVHRDCDGDGIHDFYEIQANSNLDLDFDGVLDSCQQSCGSIPYGQAVSPSVNRVVLRAEGPVEPDTELVLTSSFCPPNTPVLVGLGFSPLNLPLVGGTMLIGPGPAALFTLFTTSDACGVSTFVVQIPDDPTLANVSLYWQTFALDFSQPKGWSLSNGVRTTLCP